MGACEYHSIKRQVKYRKTAQRKKGSFLRGKSRTQAYVKGKHGAVRKWTRHDYNRTFKITFQKGLWPPAVKKKLTQFRSKRFTPEETLNVISQFILETEQFS